MKTIRPFCAVLLLAFGVAAAGIAEDIRPDAVSKAAIFLPLDFYSRHREALGLTAEQASELERLAESIRTTAKKLEGERAKRMKAVLEAMAQSPVAPDEAMARFQALLDAENHAKTLQFRSAIELRNALTPGQLRIVEELAARDDGTRLSSSPANLKERIQQLRAELQKRNGDDLSPAVVGQLKEIEQTARQGRAGEAKEQLEALLKQLRQSSVPAAGETPAASTKESPR